MIDTAGEREPHDYQPEGPDEKCRICGGSRNVRLHEEKVEQDEREFQENN